jgi:RNA recognition motif-containing protein
LKALCYSPKLSDSHFPGVVVGMSRLIIKNVPAYLTSERLKSHFTQPKGPGGTITDVKVALKQDGTSRRFGFIGYKTEAEAEKARQWFDKTFIDSTRVRVEVIDVSLRLCSNSTFHTSAQFKVCHIATCVGFQECACAPPQQTSADRPISVGRLSSVLRTERPVAK